MRRRKKVTAFASERISATLPPSCAAPTAVPQPDKVLFVRVLIVISLLLLTACSSNLRKGDNMMEAEQYDQAVMYYQRALAEDPGDDDIALKLYEARTRMVAAYLIKVRLQRQGEQPKAAAMLLNQTLKHIKQWKIIADSGVKATIEEEVWEAGKWLNRELKTLGQSRAYNRYFYYLAQFDEIEQTGLADEAKRQYQQSMTLSGQRQCQQLESSLTPFSHYLHQYWQAYCAVFSLAVDYRLAPDPSRYAGFAVQNKQVDIARSANINADAVAEKIQRQLQDHLWFSDHGTRSLTLTLRGKVDYAKRSQRKRYTRVYKAKQETWQQIKDPNNPKKVIRTLIHKKPVEKTVTFYGEQITETSGHQLRLSGRINQHNLDVKEIISHAQHVTDRHDTYFKSEGIYPKAAQYFNQQAWQQGMGKELIDKTRQRLDQLWLQAYCQPQTTGGRYAAAEYPARCAQLNSDHASVRAWTQATFDLTHGQLMVMLKPSA